MRTKTIVLDGREYRLCFSLRVSRDCCERYGSVANIGSALGGKSEADKVNETVWLFCAMAEAGRRYAQRNGLDPLPPPLSEDDIFDALDVQGLSMLVTQLHAVIADGSAPEIEVATEGKAQATRDQSSPSGSSGTD